MFLLAKSSHLRTSLPMSSRKFTCGQVKNKFGGVDILHIHIVLSIYSCAFSSYRLGFSHVYVAFCIHMYLLGIGVPHGVPGDVWVHLELKRGD